MTKAELAGSALEQAAMVYAEPQGMDALSMAYDHSDAYKQALRAAAIKYAHQVLGQLKILDGGVFHTTLDQLVGDILQLVDKHPKMRLP